ncbi:MAG: arylsulfatase [Opitutales bacterium TMED158]|nr:MAG: arylsulfatase [Opitutales bacterium TMED158]
MQATPAHVKPIETTQLGLILIALSSIAFLEAKQPNILILYADDLGYGDLTIQNPDSKIPTPRLDGLARESMRFTDGHSSSGICTPSRYALLTGRHHWRKFHGIVNALGASIFDDERLTLPEMLRSKGYRTAAIGKWHLGWDWDALRKEELVEGEKKPIAYDAFDWSRSIPDGPLAHGFDHYFGDTVINFPPYCWIEDDRVTKAPDTMMDADRWKPIKEGRWECRPGPMVSDWDPYENIPTITRRAVDYIKGQSQSADPFFLYFALPSPHAPIIPNDAFDGRSQAGPYGDFVVESDDAIGQLLDALRETGQWENTVVFFSADNGPEKYAYERDRQFDHWSAHPFRGLKRDIYEGGHHVPFFIRWPGVTPSNSRSDALVSQIDFMATIADAIGYELPDNQAEDSHSLWPLLNGEANSVRSTHIHNTRENQYAIRDGDWVLVDTENGYMSGRNETWESKRAYAADDDQAVELYHLAQDIGQRRNVAAANPERVAFMQALLRRIREQGYSAPRIER